MAKPAPSSLLLVLLLAGSTAIAAACDSRADDVRASINASFTLPRAILDKANKLEIRVLEGPVTCDEATGLLGNEEAGKEIAKSELGTSSCAAGAKFCGSVQIEKSADVRMFSAKATATGGATVAVGCAAATVNQDAISLTLRMFRFLAPSNCGDGVLQPTEQCDPAGGPLCDDSCQSTEVLLSLGSSGNKTVTGKAGDKTDPFFLWPTGSGDSGRFLAFYTDHAVPSGGGTLDVGLRVMSADLSPVSTPPALASGSIFLPNGGAFPPAPAALQQSLPQAAFFGGEYWVVFDDDSGSSLDIHARSINNVFVSDQGLGAPININGTGSGEPAIQTAPAISASSERLLVAWEDQAGGKIVGRTLTPPSTLGSQNELSVGNGNARPQIAATGKSWVTVWKSGTGIKLRAVDANGTPSGSDQSVNASGAGADGAHIASLPDGRFAVVWSAGGDVFLQRYDAKGLAIAGDQDQPLNDIVKDGDQNQPTIAAMPAAGGSYVVAWYDASTGHVKARFAGGTSGFLFNNVNGQTSEFQASRVEGRDRNSPVVAVGGSGPFIAIGWEDKGTTNAGIIVRRFPIPVE